MAAAERIALRVPRDTYYLSLIRHAVVDLARRVGFEAAATAEIEMAVDEACSNAVRHAEGDAVSIEAVADASGIAVTVHYGGEPFAFERCGAPDLEAYLAERQPGGLGVYIIRRFMDEVEYRHRPDCGNELRMRKYLAGSWRTSTS